MYFHSLAGTWAIYKPTPGRDRIPWEKKLMRHYGAVGGRALECSKDPWEATVVRVEMWRCTCFLMSSTIWGGRTLGMLGGGGPRAYQKIEHRAYHVSGGQPHAMQWG